jgi:hypothetical protein
MLFSAQCRGSIRPCEQKSQFHGRNSLEKKPTLCFYVVWNGGGQVDSAFVIHKEEMKFSSGVKETYMKARIATTVKKRGHE